MAANIYGVAKLARVSVATVSAVVNDSAYVSPQLKARVRAAIGKLGYQPNLLARSLAKQKSHMLGMIVPNIANPFWPEVVRGAEDRAHESGYTLLIASSDDSAGKEELYLTVFLKKRVDGILIAKAPGKLGASLVTQLRAARIPLTRILRVGDECPCDTVTLDDRDAAYEAVSHLLRLGHRRIGIISGPTSVSTSRRRLAGYRQALKDWKLPLEAVLCFEGDFGTDSGYTGGVALLRKRPEAVFVANYPMAVGFMKAVRQYQLRCPQDVALVTCDDHPWMDSFSPRLTTVNFPKYDLGAAAARLLIERLANRKRPVETLELKSSLSIRESCGYLLKIAAARNEPAAAPA